MNKLLNTINWILILFMSIGAFWLIPNFIELFIGLDIELPLITKAVINTYSFWWTLTFISIALHLIFTLSPKSAQSTLLTKFLAVETVLLIALIPLTIYALYLPILHAAS